MKRALAGLTAGAFLTLVVGVVGSGRPAASLLLGAAFALLATAGFGWVQRRPRRVLAFGYVGSGRSDYCH